MPTWDDLYRDGRSLGREPDPWLVSLVAGLRASGVERVLDLGCGTGRHVVHLAACGFEVTGADISRTGVALTRSWLESEARPSRLAVADMHDLPFADEALDAVVSFHVLYHSDRAGMMRALGEVRRVLRSGGIFAGTFISTRTWKYGLGPQVEPNTFVQPDGAEAGVPHHYCDEPEMRDLLHEFELLDAHLDEREMDGEEKGLHSHWQVVARC